MLFLRRLPSIIINYAIEYSHSIASLKKIEKFLNNAMNMEKNQFSFSKILNFEIRLFYTQKKKVRNIVDK